MSDSHGVQCRDSKQLAVVYERADWALNMVHVQVRRLYDSDPLFECARSVAVVVDSEALR